MKLKLTERQVNNYAEEIYEILRYIPLFYIDEILELAKDGREKDGPDPEIDLSSSDEEDNSSVASATSDP